MPNHWTLDTNSYAQKIKTNYPINPLLQRCQGHCQGILIVPKSQIIRLLGTNPYVAGHSSHFFFLLKCEDHSSLWYRKVTKTKIPLQHCLPSKSPKATFKLLKLDESEEWMILNNTNTVRFSTEFVHNSTIPTAQSQVKKKKIGIYFVHVKALHKKKGKKK